MPIILKFWQHNWDKPNSDLTDFMLKAVMDCGRIVHKFWENSLMFNIIIIIMHSKCGIIYRIYFSLFCVFVSHVGLFPINLPKNSKKSIKNLIVVFVFQYAWNDNDTGSYLGLTHDCIS